MYIIYLLIDVTMYLYDVKGVKLRWRPKITYAELHQPYLTLSRDLFVFLTPELISTLR